MRKTLSIVLSLLMVLSIFSPVFAEEDVKDVTAETMEKNEEYIEFLKEINIVKGDKSGDLMLDKDIDRASFAAILVRADGKEAVAESVKTLPSKFADMTAAHWANGYATVAHDNLWMKGNTANEFMPGKEISYAEIATTLVRFLGEEKDGMVYPTSYIAKATELGLFKGVEEIAGEYTKNAVRKNVFMMLYNALSREDFGKYNVYKVIVLENSRVAKLADNQLKAEVLSVVQMANNVNERGVAKVGQQMVFNIEDLKKVEGGLADTENLLGKVANFTVDQDGKIVKAVIDNSYEYLAGGITSLDDKYFGVNYVKKAVRVDERYYNRGLNAGRYDRDDRMYRTYLTTNKGTVNYNYEEFAAENKAERINPNFARMTVKDGMVLFVDAYGLRDIAPVQKVERDGEDVYYYNDERNGAVERTIINSWDTVIAYNAKDGFSNYDRKNIKTDDVIHWMDGFYLVRTDAKLQATLDKTFVDYRGERALLKVAEDKTLDRNLSTVAGGTVPPYRSVFAYDDMHFRRTENRGQLSNMVGSEVKVLLDVRNAIQLITSHEKFTDRIALVDKTVSAKGMEFYAANAPEEWKFRLTDSWDSNYYRRHVLNAQQANRFDRFVRLDLAHTAADKDGNAKLVATIDGYEYTQEPSTFPVLWRGKLQQLKEGEKALGRYYGHDWEFVSFPANRRNIIKVGNRDLRYSDETDVFVINAKRDRYDNNWSREAVVKATLADVMKYDGNNGYLGAVALTEKEYAKFLKDEGFANYSLYSDTREDFVKAIVFTNYTGPMAEVDNIEYGRVDVIYLYSNQVKVELRPGVYETFNIHRDSNLNFRDDVKVDDYVILRRIKDAKEPTAVFEKRIVTEIENAKKDVLWTAPGYVVENRSAYNLKVAGFTTPFKTDEITVEFGDVRGNRKAYVYAPANGLADLVVYEPYNGAPAATGTVTWINKEVADNTKDVLKLNVTPGKVYKVTTQKEGTATPGTVKGGVIADTKYTAFDLGIQNATGNDVNYIVKVYEDDKEIASEVVVAKDSTVPTFTAALNDGTTAAKAKATLDTDITIEAIRDGKEYNGYVVDVRIDANATETKVTVNGKTFAVIAKKDATKKDIADALNAFPAFANKFVATTTSTDAATATSATTANGEDKKAQELELTFSTAMKEVSTMTLKIDGTEYTANVKWDSAKKVATLTSDTAFPSATGTHNITNVELESANGVKANPGTGSYTK